MTGQNLSIFSIYIEIMEAEYLKGVPFQDLPLIVWKITLLEISLYSIKKN